MASKTALYRRAILARHAQGYCEICDRMTDSTARDGVCGVCIAETDAEREKVWAIYGTPAGEAAR